MISENRAGALAATQYLTGLGHRRIGYIGGRPELQSSTQRLQGYTDGLTQVGLPLEPDLVQAGDYTRQTGYLSAKNLLGLPKPPTAVFAANDASALGVMEAAREAGLHIPEDLSVVGFDNIPESAYFYPALTTISQNQHELGCKAVQELVDKIEAIRNNELNEPQNILLMPELIIRESSVKS